MEGSPVWTFEDGSNEIARVADLSQIDVQHRRPGGPGCLNFRFKGGRLAHARLAKQAEARSRIQVPQPNQAMVRVVSGPPPRGDEEPRAVQFDGPAFGLPKA